MSQLDKYIQEILDNAKKVAEETLTRAEQEAEKIIADAKKQAEEIAKQKVREYIETEKNKIIDATIREQLGMKAKLKASIIDRLNHFVLELLKEQIMSEDFDYPQFLFKLLVKGIKTLGANSIKILANSRDIEFLKTNLDIFNDKLRAIFGSTIEITIEGSIETLGGLIVKSNDETRSFNATLEGLAKHYLYLLEPPIIRQLGLITQNRFRSLIKKMFKKILATYEIIDIYGNKLVLSPCLKLSELY